MRFKNEVGMAYFVGCNHCMANAGSDENWNRRSTVVVPAEKPGDEREAFEKALKEWRDWPLDRMPIEGLYKDKNVQLAWCGWELAVAALSAHPKKEAPP